MAVLRCTEAFAYSEPNGVQRVLRPGDLVESNDPAVKGRKQWFETVEANVQRATERAAGKPVDGVIEQATAAPGEKRTLTEREADENAELGRLQVEAEKAGVKVDKRWGVDRLREELAKAKG